MRMRLRSQGVGAVLPGPLARLRKEGPYEALKQMTAAISSHMDCDAAVEQARDVASWVLAVLDDSIVTNPAHTPASRAQALRKASVSLLAGRVPVLRTNARFAASPALRAEVEALGERWENVEPMLAEIVPLLQKIKSEGPDAERVDRAPELTVLIWVALLEFDEATKGDLTSAAKAISTLATKRYLEGILAIFSIRALDDYLSEHAKTKVVWKNLGKWAPVLGGLAEAKSAEDAQAILDAAAAPLGSYREFTQGGWKGFISGWAGIGGGADWMLRGDDKRAAAVGPMLPIGVEIGHPLGDGPSSFQLLISVIDVGALAIARFDDDAVNADEGMDGEGKIDSDSSLSSVFAPGVFLGVRPSDWPFVISAGAEFLPRSIVKFDCDDGEATCESTRAVPTVRFMLSVAFDLTAFRLF